MPALKLNISDYKVLDLEKANTVVFSIWANGIKLEVKADRFNVKNPLTRPATLKAVNEQFRNSLRYFKHMGNFPKAKKMDADQMRTAMNTVWSQTDTGIAIRPAHDPLPEFKPFFDIAEAPREKKKMFE